MPKTKGEMKYLQPWKGYFRVRIRVPREVQATVAAMLGRDKPVTELVEALGIPESKPCVAERMKHDVVARFLGQIEEARASLRGEVVRYWHPPQPYQPFMGGIKKYRLTTEPAVAAATPVTTFAAIIEKKYAGVDPKDKGKHDTETQCGNFAQFLGHDDMTRVTFENLRDYRDSLKGKLADKTISNHLKNIKAVFSYAAAERIAGLEADPVAKVPNVSDDYEEVPPFEPNERAAVLAAAEKASDGIKWINYLGAFSTLRKSEITRATKESVRFADGVCCFVVNRQFQIGRANTKTKQSARHVPIHSSLVKAGFLEYVAGLQDGAQLIPGNGTLEKQLGAFYRGLGFTYQTSKGKIEVKTYNSHRHFATTALRSRHDIDSDIKRYLLAHGRGDQHMKYGGFGVEALVTAIETIPGS
jgi:hypothetical protein